MSFLNDLKKNGKLDFEPRKISRFRMWGNWSGIEEHFELTSQLGNVTKLEVGTVAEVSQLATTALS